MNFREKFPVLFQNGIAYGDAICDSDVDTLCREYRQLVEHAPKRKREFGERDGTTTKSTSNKGSTRRFERERRIEMALFNLQKVWFLEGVGRFRLLDYQFPLKSRRSDIGLGKVDLLGLTSQEQPLVVELKVTRKSGDGVDSPMEALLEALRYTACIEANESTVLDHLWRKNGSEEVRRNSKRARQDGFAPVVMILGEESWWRWWENKSNGRCAMAAMDSLAQALEGELGIGIHFAKMTDVMKENGLSGTKPRLAKIPIFTRAEL